MMDVQVYAKFIERQREELNNFPIAYAFNQQQLDEALEKLGVTDLYDCVTVFNHGDIVKRDDAPKLIELMRRHTQEMADAMKDKEFAEAAFLYEMDNHEYAINWDGDDDVLNCFGLDFEKLRELGLEDAYRRARKQHMKHAQEWEMI